jgi:hypothetical protein
MSYTISSKPSSFDDLHRLKKRWQRGLAIEYALIASFLAFTVIQFLFVVVTKAS